MTRSPHTAAQSIQSTGDHQSSNRIAVLARIKGIFVCIGALGCGSIGWITLGILAENLRRNPDAAVDMSAAALGMINHSWWLPVSSLAVLAVGVLMIVAKVQRSTAWLLFVLGMVGILAIFIAILYCFIGFIAPMYQYRPL